METTKGSKKVYETPYVEKIEFDYKEQVIATSEEYLGQKKADYYGGDCTH